MSYCRHCGSEIVDNTIFCPNCGQNQNTPTAPAHQSRSNSGKRLHCPNCRSLSISPVVETEVSSGLTMSHSVTRKSSISSTGLYNTHRNYWICSECGHKFRNLQNLEEELAKNISNVKRAIIGIVLVIVIMIVSLIVNGLNILHILMLPALAFIIAAVGITRNKIAKLKTERAYLKKNCFH